MDMIIETPKMGEILLEEFMEPLGISAYKLAREIHVPVSRIQDILHNRRKITVDTSLRLARYFGVSDRYFLDIQNDIDIRELKLTLDTEIEAISGATITSRAMTNAVNAGFAYFNSLTGGAAE